MPGFGRRSTCYRRELRATGSRGCSERCPPDSSDAEARHCQSSSRGVSDLVATGDMVEHLIAGLCKVAYGYMDDILLHVDGCKTEQRGAWPSASTIQTR